MWTRAFTAYTSIVSNYTKVIEYIQQYQPDAKIIIQSNMHVTKKKSDANPNTFSNARIDELNRRLAALADNKKPQQIIKSVGASCISSIQFF